MQLSGAVTLGSHYISPVGGRAHTLVLSKQPVQVTRIRKPKLMNDLVHLHIGVAQPRLDQA